MQVRAGFRQLPNPQARPATPAENWFEELKAKTRR